MLAIHNNKNCIIYLKIDPSEILLKRGIKSTKKISTLFTFLSRGESLII